MKIEGDGTVVFKSESYYFKQERDGLKPNTVRLLTYDEEQEVEGWVHVDEIRIECVRAHVDDTCFDPFTRTLTSIEQIGEYALAQDNELTLGAIILKKKLLAMVEEAKSQK